MENEENRGLIDKKASEDQLAALVSVKLLAQAFAQVLEQGREKQAREGQEKEIKDQARKNRIKQLQQEYLHVTYCMCDFLVGFDMYDFACWCMILLLSVAWFCRVMKMVFSLTLPFSRCHGVLGC